MRDSNRAFIVSGLGAAVLNAEMEIDDPPFPNIPAFPKIYWEDATEEQRQDKDIMWVTAPMFGKTRKYFLRSYTNEEKEIIKKREKWRLEQMFDYILKVYGWEYAIKFYQDSSWSDKFKKYNIVIDTRIPHCKYANGQCDLFCEYLSSGRCEYAET